MIEGKEAKKKWTRYKTKQNASIREKEEKIKNIIENKRERGNVRMKNII